MYFWKIDQLVADFRENKVSQSEQLKYILLYGFIAAVFVHPFFYQDVIYTQYDMAYATLYPLITLLGIYYCYLQNVKGDNRDFITRIMCIGLPAIVRFLVFFVPIFIAVTALEHFLGIDTEGVSVYSMITFIAFDIAYYCYLAVKIKAVADNGQESSK